MVEQLTGDLSQSPAQRNTRFDLYHAGIPWIREIGIIGKSYPNVWLNLCWVHIISQKLAVAALDEWLDLVPYNKIIGFGGDYGKPVEKVFGHLEMAREDIAEVLAGRVAAGYFGEDEALRIARAWLFDNPNELYSLKVQQRSSAMECLSIRISQMTREA